MSWAEYKKKRKEQENMETSYSRENNDSNNETSSWQKYKQKREEQKVQQTETLPIANKANTVNTATKTTTNLTETESNTDKSVEEYREKMEKIRQNTDYNVPTVNIMIDAKGNVHKITDWQSARNAEEFEKLGDYKYTTANVDENGNIISIKDNVNKSTNSNEDFKEYISNLTAKDIITEMLPVANNIGSVYAPNTSYILTKTAKGEVDAFNKMENWGRSHYGQFLESMASKTDNQEKSDKYQQKAEEQRNKIKQNYNDIQRQIYRSSGVNNIGNTLGDVGQTIGEMSPAILANFIPVVGKFISPVISATTVAGGDIGEGIIEDGESFKKANIGGDLKGTASAVIEKLVGGVNIGGAGALDDIVGNTIAKKTTNNITNFLATKGYQIFGEVAEENIENLVDYAIDKIVDDKDFPELKTIWTEAKETSKMTFLTTLALNCLGFGGENLSTYKEMENITGKTLTKTQKESLNRVIENVQDKIQKNEMPELSQNAQNNIEQQTIQTDTKTAQNQNMSQISDTNENNLKNTAINEINNSKISEQAKKDMLNAINSMENVDEESYNNIKQTLNEINKNELQTNSKYQDNLERRKNYVKYKDDINTYDNSAVEEVLSIIPTNRNGKRTVNQWLQVADEIGKRISGKSNAEIQEIAYKSWFENQPTKNITQYDSARKTSIGFQKLNSDMWVNKINEAVLKERTRLENTTNSQQVNFNNTQTNQESLFEDILNNKELPMQSYIYEKSDNPNVDILRKSASKYLNNSEQAHKFVQILEKISQDKNVEIRFDADLKTPEGKIANGSYSNGVITINPNSTRAGEFIAIHELTHAIGTKQMENIIEKYSKSNIEFNEETKKLLQNYSNTEMNEEALADISGQLFGTQEFINNISQNNPNVFQRIYSEIKYLWHQFKGYKTQDQFIDDLYYKWTQAYNSNNKLNLTNKYYIETIEDFDEMKYNNIKELRLPKQEYAILSGIVNSDSNIKPGRNYIETTNATYEVYFKDTGEFKVIDKIVDGGYNDTITNGNIQGTGNTRNAESGLQVHSSTVQQSRTRTRNDEISNFNKKRTRISDKSSGNGSSNSSNVKYSIQESENNSGSFSINSQNNVKTGVEALENYKNNKKQEYEKIADEFGGGSYFWEANLDGIDKDSAIRMLKRDSRVQQKFIENNKFEKVYKPVEYSRFKTQEMQNFIKDNNITSLKDLVNNQKLTNEYFDLWFGKKESLNDYTKQSYEAWKDLFDSQVEVYSRGGETLRVLKSFERDIKNINSGVTKIIDEYETAKKLENMPEFNKYVEKFVDPLYGEKPKLSTEELTELAQDTFGTTTNFDVGAYMTPDGKLLNFGDHGYRNDHRDISSIGYDMQEFIDAGNIRMKPEGNGFELKLEPTSKQYETLSDYIDILKGEVYVEIDIGNDKYDGANYKEGTPTSKIINDLQYYFENGKFPKQSELAQFRYSQNNKTWQDYLEKNYKTAGTRTNMQDILVSKATNNNKERVRDILSRNGSFSEQVDKYIADKLPSGDFLYLGETPTVLQNLGLPNNEVILKQSKLKTLMQESNNNTDKLHELPIETIKKIPEAIANPLNILQSSTDENSVVIITDLADANERPIIASIEVNYDGQIGNIDFLSNRLTSAYGKNNYDRFMKTEIAKGNLLYDIDEGIIKELPATRLQSPKGISSFVDTNNNVSTINNSISQNNDSVKSNTIITNNYEQQTQNDTHNNQNVAPSVANNSLPVGEYTGKQRKHYKSIMESAETTPQAKKIAKELLNSDTYVPETNKGQLERADARIMSSTPESELNSLSAKAINGEKISSVDIAVGERLIQYYSKTGNAVKLQEAIQTTAMAGTSAGQTVQALSLLNHQTPQGQAMWLQKSVDKMNNELARRKGGKINKDENGNIRVTNNKGVDITEKVELFNLTPEMIQNVVSSKNDTELNKNLNKVYEQLGQQVTRTTAQKIDAWRYFSMLANPKTHIRNITGNVAMGGVQGIKNKVAGVIEGVANKINPDMERSHTIKPASKEVKAFAKADIENVTDRLGLSENKYNPKTRLENSMRTFKSDVMENTVGKMFDLNNKALEVEDGWGLKAGYAKALSEYMTANNLTPDTITDKQLGKARNYAIQQAKEATFHQDSSIASLLNQLSNKNKFSKFILDATLPFKKTPVNVAKAGLEYSPVGLVKSAIYDTVQLRKGNITVNTYIDNVSKGLTGSGIALVGYALADCGILKATGSDDEDREKFEESRGSQNYSVKIGDNTYSLDWLAPSGIPLFIGAECYELMQAQKEKKTSSSDEDELYNKAINTATNILDSFANAMNPMTEMSMLSGLTSALKSYDQDSSKMLASIGTNAVKSYVNQFVPTALGQVAKTTDQYERSTTSTQKGVLPKAIDTTRTQIMNKIPGLRQMLPIKTDIWGNEIEQSDNVIQRAFENAVFPWARKELNSNSVDKELVKVYKNTGDKAVLPDSINKEITINKQKYTMTSGEYSKYKKQYGENSYKLLNSLVTANGYKKMSDEEKRVAISKIYSYATEQIKVDYAKQNGLEYEQSTLSQVTNAIKKVNGNTSNYFEFIAKTQELDKDIEKIKTLANSNYDENTKKAIYENSLGKRDNKFNIMKETFTTNGLNTTKYLKYKSQEFESDKTDDGTLNGKTVNGSKKKKVWNYIEQMDITYTQKLLLYGLEYTPSNREQTQIVNYINSLPKTQQEKLEMLSKFQGFTIYKDGTFKL